MATLLGTKIKDTYAGLLKTDNNLEMGSGVSGIQDGAGNQSALYLGQDAGKIVSGDNLLNINATNTQLKGTTLLASDATDTNLMQLDANIAAIGNATNYLTIGATNSQFVGDVDFTVGSTVDFTGTTVTGIDTGVQSVVAGTNVTVDNTDPANPIVSAAGGGGSANLVNGTGSNSLQQVDGLLDLDADASGTSSISLGRNSLASQEGTVGIGNYGRASAAKAIAIGQESTASGQNSISMGFNTVSSGSNSIAIGVQAKTYAANAIGIGNYASYLGAFQASQSVMIGQDNGYAGGAQAVSVGYNCTAKATGGIAIGASARIESSAYTNSIAIGASSDTLNVGAVALGYGIQASRENTVSINELEIQSVGGGITMYSPNGSEFLLTVTDAGALLVTSI